MHVLIFPGRSWRQYVAVNRESTPYLRADEQNCHKREGVIDLALIQSDWIVAFRSAFSSRINFSFQICLLTVERTVDSCAF